MKTANLLDDLTYNDNKPAIKVLFETDFTKEIRIAMKTGVEMKKHQTSFPIVVEIVQGQINFGVNEQVLHLKKGDLIALDGGVPHDLTAKTNCIVRLTLSKLDSVQRVKDVEN
jgi:quercetin dioxygenase-like cupin family protein